MVKLKNFFVNLISLETCFITFRYKMIKLEAHFFKLHCIMKCRCYMSMVKKILPFTSFNLRNVFWALSISCLTFGGLLETCEGFLIHLMIYHFLLSYYPLLPAFYDSLLIGLSVSALACLPQKSEQSFIKVCQIPSLLSSKPPSYFPSH